MYRSARCALRAIRPAPTTTSSLVTAPTRRFASTSASTKKTGTWKGTVVRWGLAGAALYYYNTSPIFADQVPQPQTAPAEFSEADLPTIDALIEEKRRHAPPPPPPQATKAAVAAEIEQVANEEESKPTTESPVTAATELEPGSPEALEQEASQQGAFNPETGEINWDCPCLGGMAHGPCGEEFKAAFSCFVYSKEEPKGIECIDKFQGMQTCFRQYPEIYGSELNDDDDDETVVAPEGIEVATKAPESDAKSAEQAEKDREVQKLVGDIQAKKKKEAGEEKKEQAEKKVEQKVEEKKVEDKNAVPSPVPKEAVDATDANNKQ
ncbi:Oxidoreductase [Podospora bellae-mahoneyi]|uniref:Mitochondrial intermembrane space import and assembly protein 40 n=1 Tax=Podospora bellae-mahoneyi TaxID=2093777 RepID=A0ABR0FL31_9PEZI|nr:Oxidoreductase [Podospora bellae-mahoneyi]